jgi:hypothetical protein
MHSARADEGKIFQALADPSRRAIFEALARGEAAVKDLTARFDISQPAVSQHLAALKDAWPREQPARRPLRLLPSGVARNETPRRLDGALPRILDGARGQARTTARGDGRMTKTAVSPFGSISVRGARQNNLKDVSVEIPKRRLTVFTGVSARASRRSSSAPSRRSRSG